MLLLGSSREPFSLVGLEGLSAADAEVASTCGDDMCKPDCLVTGSARIVVLRCRFDVSAEGGRGRFAIQDEAGNIVARQRKHSPVP